MPAIVWMQATVRMTAIMTAHNSRNASNSRNDSKNRTSKTVWTPSKAGMLAKDIEADNSMERGQQQ
jgi:hypothetical protein